MRNLLEPQGAGQLDGVSGSEGTKLRWALGAHRSKDRDDIRNILAVQGPTLDSAYLDRWSSVHGTATLLAEIRASVPPL